MRLHSILIIFIFTSFKGLGQNIDSNHCDSSILTQQELEKCKRDSFYNSDIIIRSNYIIFLKNRLLPKYRIQRQALFIPDEIKKQIELLKSIYDSTLNYKLQRMTIDMDRNQKYVQPKAYISTLLAYEVFKFYPDVNAILLNEIHLILNPKTSQEQITQIQKLIYTISFSLSIKLKEEVQQITLSMTEERKAYTKGQFYDMLQGSIDDDKRNELNIINFLIWTN
jgi:hypothetical protein